MRMNVFKHYLLVLAISTLPLISIFITKDLPHTHDGLVHLPRMAAYEKALSSGQILPRWASELNFGYGMPLFNFIYHTPYLLSSLLIMANVSLVLTFKLIISLSFLLSAVTMFAFSRELLADNKKAFIVTLFYQFAPFRLVEVIERGSFGEIYTYAFLPLVLYGLIKFSKKQNFSEFIKASIATGLLIISHNSISLIFFGAASLFVLFFFKMKHVILGFLSLIIGLLLSLFYWLPALLEHKYTLGDLYMKDVFRQHFPPFLNFFIPNFFNAKQLQTEAINVQLGIFHVLAIVAALFLIIHKKKLDSLNKRIILYSLTLFGLSLFLMQPVSTILWERISFLRQFQFPWRLLSLTSVATALLSPYIFSYSIFRNKWIYLTILTGVVVTTAFFWYPPLGFDKATNEREFWDYPLTTTYYGETDIIWSAGPAKKPANFQIEPIEGNLQISSIVKNQTVHTAVINAATDGKVVDNTQYFPGWKVYVNDLKTQIEFQDINYRGLITFPVSKGTSQIRVTYERSGIARISESISLATAIILGVIYFIYSRKKYS